MGWAATKKRIIGSDVQQLHRDELSNELKTYIDSEKLDLPVVLGQESTDAPLKVLMKKGELADCSKDHEKFLGALQKNASGEGIALNIQSNSLTRSVLLQSAQELLMVLTTICQLPFFHQDLQWCICGLLTKHDGEIQLLRVDVGFQLVTQLISMELLDIASNYSLLRCSPPSSFIQMQAVMCQVAC